MGFFNCNITGAGGAGGASGLVTKFTKSVTLTGEETAEIAVSLVNDIINYENISNEQIIIELTGGSALVAGSYELTHSYDSTTGSLTITSTNSSVPFGGEDGSTVEFNIYVSGAVQLPPVPDSCVYDLGFGTTFNIAAMLPNHFANLTVDDFIVSVVSMPEASIGTYLFGDGGNWISGKANGFTVTKTYEGGTLTINAKQTLIRACNIEKGNLTTTQTATCKVYAVLGNILSV